MSNWYRIDMCGQDSILAEIDLDQDQLNSKLASGAIVKTNQQLCLLQHRQQDNSIKLSVMHKKDMSPLYKMCGEEFINLKLAVGYGLIDKNSSLWSDISKNVLDKNNIVVPPNKVVV